METRTEIRPDLPPADTLSATLRFDSGVVGAYIVSYAVDAPWPLALHVTGEAGTLRVHRQKLEVTSGDATHDILVAGHQGVEAELADFAVAIRQEHTHRNTPRQALQDVAIIEALLRSAETGCRVIPERVVTPIQPSIRASPGGRVANTTAADSGPG